MDKYNPARIEEKWQKIWEEKNLYLTKEDKLKPKYYCLDFFPYPSGASLSVGHCRNYVPTDVISRYKRMQGFNVLHPMGWDAFGLPAENDAIKKGLHPTKSIPSNVANFKRQLKLIGTSYDWSREINSTDPRFYRWTQWFFLLLYKRGLAYQAVAEQWWCPSCKTVLANEQVEGGRCWRCGSEVVKKGLKQWFFKIADYADRLLTDIDKIDWPEKIKVMQRNWIGRSEGIVIDYPVSDSEHLISCFTTRPDTNFGATFVVMAPEHPLVMEVTKKEHFDTVNRYIENAKRKSEIERIAEGREKSGAFTGSYVENRLTGRKIPIWISDFVLGHFGTGVVVGVPGHDLRDFEFAQKFNLPITRVVVDDSGDQSEIINPGQVFEGEGKIVNSDFLNGLTTKEGIEKIIKHLEDKGWGKRSVSYKMRDWLISRQRYWGAPIPIIHCEKCGAQPVDEEDLPVLLPEIDSFKSTEEGRSPLAKVEEFVNTTCPSCGGPGKRETDTQDGFACSSWYPLRFTSSNYDTFAFRKEAMEYWMPVDLYVGGAEHAVMHLLYSRFYTKVMHDAGLIPFDEPFKKLMNQGMILAQDGRKMSKSLGNVITPDETVKEFGADALRLFELFIGPFEQEIAWSQAGIRGTLRFLERYWNLIFEKADSKVGERNIEVERIRNKTIKKVGDDLENFKFNTAVSSLMEFLNEVQKNKLGIPSNQLEECLRDLTLLLAPIAPHVAEEVWQERFSDGQNESWSVHQQNWPRFNPNLILEEESVVAIQVNGKLREKIKVAKGTSQRDIEQIAFDLEKVKQYTRDKKVIKIVFVSDRILNIVIK